MAVTGPVPAVFQILNYWNANLLQFSESAVAKNNIIYGTILKTIYYEVEQLTQGSVENVNELIAGFIHGLVPPSYAIRMESILRLKPILETGTAIAIHWNQLALQDCGGHLIELNNKLVESNSDLIFK